MCVSKTENGEREGGRVGAIPCSGRSSLHDVQVRKIKLQIRVTAEVIRVALRMRNKISCKLKRDVSSVAIENRSARL